MFNRFVVLHQIIIPYICLFTNFAFEIISKNHYCFKELLELPCKQEKKPTDKCLFKKTKKDQTIELYNRLYTCKKICEFKRNGVVTEPSFITYKDFEDNFSEEKTIFERLASENIYTQISIYMVNLILGYILLSIFKKIMKKCIKMCFKRKKKRDIEMVTVINEENRPIVRQPRAQRRIQFSPNAP